MILIMINIHTCIKLTLNGKDDDIENDDDDDIDDDREIYLGAPPSLDRISIFHARLNSGDCGDGHSARKLQNSTLENCFAAANWNNCQISIALDKSHRGKEQFRV